MKSTFAKCSRAAVDTEEFQAEVAEWKSTVSAARSVMRIRSRANFCEFIEGPLFLNMQCSLLQDFTGAGERFEKFSSNVVSILGDVRQGAEEAFISRLQRSCKRGSPQLTSYDWDVLKTDLDHKLKEMVPYIAELQLAAKHSPDLTPHHQ